MSATNEVRAHKLGLPMLAAASALYGALVEMAEEACANPKDRFPFCLAVLEATLGHAVARAETDLADLEERIEISQRHVATVARTAFFGKSKP